MKRVIVLLAFLVTVVFFTNAQTVTIKGTQTQGTAAVNASLKSNPVTIDQAMYISRAEGDCQGFWITRGSQTVKNFNTMEESINFVLKSGTYYVYPNLRPGQSSANITIFLTPKS